jgi:hypothetical protein
MDLKEIRCVIVDKTDLTQNRDMAVDCCEDVNEPSGPLPYI